MPLLNMVDVQILTTYIKTKKCHCQAMSLLYPFLASVSSSLWPTAIAVSSLWVFVETSVSEQFTER